MEQKLVWRCRAPDLPDSLKLVAEVRQVGEVMLYLRLFAGEVVECVPIAPDKAGQLLFGLVSQGWHTE